MSEADLGVRVSGYIRIDAEGVGHGRLSMAIAPDPLPLSDEIEITEAMIEAGCEAKSLMGDACSNYVVQAIYEAMLKARK